MPAADAGPPKNASRRLIAEASDEYDVVTWAKSLPTGVRRGVLRDAHPDGQRRTDRGDGLHPGRLRRG